MCVIRGLKLNKESSWNRLAVSFLKECYESDIVLMIVLIVIKRTLEADQVNEAPALQIGTLSRNTFKE